MNVLVDTPVWSLALRRRRSDLSRKERGLVLELEELIRDRRAEILGPIRQEVLTGVRSETQFEFLRRRLESFSDIALVTADFEEAARCGNRCMRRGVQGTAVDFLVCAAAIRRGLAVFSTDRDFERYARHLPLHLHALNTSIGEADT